MRCPNCGLENPPSALRCDCGYNFPSGTMEQPHSLPEKPGESTRKKHTWLTGELGTRTKYVLLSLDLAILSIWIASTLGNLTWMTLEGRFDEAGRSAGSGGSILFLVLLFVLADRLWKSILRFESESDARFKKKHRKFTAIAASIAGVLLVASVVLGMRIASVYARGGEMRSLIATFAAEDAKYVEYGKRMSQIRSKRPSTYEEYYRQCLAIESLLNQWQPDYQRKVALVTSMSELVNKHPELNTPKVIAKIQFLKDMDDKDAEIFGAVREEISKVKELAKLPNSRRTSYYNAQIRPVSATEERLAREESAIVAKGRQAGL